MNLNDYLVDTGRHRLNTLALELANIVYTFCVIYYFTVSSRIILMIYDS